MTLLIPHNTKYIRHSVIPYLWKAVCSCNKWSAYAPTEEKIKMACDEHKFAEDPFPDMDESDFTQDELPEHLK